MRNKLGHKWKRYKTSIGVMYECKVCKTWTKKLGKKGNCYGKEIR